MKHGNIGSKLVEKLKPAFGVSVEIRRGSETNTVTMVPGRSVTETDQGDGAFITYHALDFHCKRDEYAFGGVAVEPEERDRISWGDRRFEVAYPADGKPYRAHTQFGDSYRIHTKEIPKTD